jgi:hypothetical protein
MGAKKQTIGYRYYLSLLSGLCRGPINEIRMIKMGDQVGFDGHICDDSAIVIDKPNLFGGEKKEGGIQGPLQANFGAKGQILRTDDIRVGDFTFPSIKKIIGGDIPEFRNVVTVWYDGLVSAMSPYVKEWKYRVRRSTAGWHGGVAWYADKATIYLSNDYLDISKSGDHVVVVNGGQTGTIQILAKSISGEKASVNGTTFEYVDAGTAQNPVVETPTTIIVRGSASANAQALKGKINDLTDSLGVTASGDGDTITIATTSSSTTIHAMNPAHILYECCTNPEWARGLPVSEMGESWVYAANTFCNEGFGLCLPWYRKDDIDVFIQKVSDLVGCVVYTDRETGLTEIKLIRDDYVVADLPVYSPSSGLIEITTDDSASSDNSYNEIIGKSVDPVSNQEFQVRAQNLASFMSKQDINSDDRDYTGIPTKTLLGRVTLRDLKTYSLGLKKFVVKLDRRSWRIAPGSCFRLVHPGRGIDVIVRAIEITDKGYGPIEFKVAQDVFGLPASSFTVPRNTTWTSPSGEALPAAHERLIEAGYRDIYLEQGAGNAESADPDAAYIGTLAAPPTTLSQQYDILTRADGEAAYVNRGSGHFTAYASLKTAIGPLDTDCVLEGFLNFYEDNTGEAFWIGDELVRLDTLNQTTGAATIVRGVADTIPAAHAAGTDVWANDDDMGSDNRDYAIGETVYAKYLTNTSSDILAEADAPEMSITLVGRQGAPYPPANVQVEGVSIYTNRSQQAPIITWNTRNRILQHDQLIGHLDPSVQPETAQFTKIVISKVDGTVIRTTDGIDGTSWEYTADMQSEDNPPGIIVVTLSSTREGHESWQKYSFQIVLRGGWGYNWGSDWGGE